MKKHYKHKMVKSRKGKHYTDFVSKAKAKFWRENISKSKKGQTITIKQKKQISKFQKRRKRL